MFEFIKKKKVGIGGGNDPSTGNSDEEAIEAPEVDGTLSDLDAALAQADKVKAQKVKDEQRERERQAALERERYSSGSRCGCG
jgi:hypothetical protein